MCLNDNYNLIKKRLENKHECKESDQEKEIDQEKKTEKEKKEEIKNTLPDVKISINNICGNKNDLKFTQEDINVVNDIVKQENSVLKGDIKDLNNDIVYKIMDTISNLSEEQLSNISQINIPIYIFNINNILISGKKNETNVKKWN